MHGCQLPGAAINEALASLVDPESIAVPGRSALAPRQQTSSIWAPELDDEFPLENWAELNDDVEALLEACTANINAFQEPRETVSALRSDLLDRIVPLETRVRRSTRWSRSRTSETTEVGQGRVHRLRDVVNGLSVRVTHPEVAQSKRAGPSPGGESGPRRAWRRLRASTPPLPPFPQQPSRPLFSHTTWSPSPRER
jgi:hypothetical protein